MLWIVKFYLYQAIYLTSLEENEAIKNRFKKFVEDFRKVMFYFMFCYWCYIYYIIIIYTLSENTSNIMQENRSLLKNQNLIVLRKNKVSYFSFVIYGRMIIGIRWMPQHTLLIELFMYSDNVHIHYYSLHGELFFVWRIIFVNIWILKFKLE